MEYDFSQMECCFSIEKIRNKTRELLKLKNKQWNEMQVDILAQGVENSDWLKLPNSKEEHLKEEIIEWISMLEEEWKEQKQFGY